MRLLLAIIIALLPGFTSAQEFIYPASVEISHPSLSVDKVVLNNNETIVELTITNQISGGWFCADRNISLINKKDNKEYFLVRSENIPNCPDRYMFKSENEKLSFKLYFDKIENPGNRIDLVENCSDNCFFFKGVILDNKLSVDIHKFESAVMNFENGNLVAAEKGFLAIISDIPSNPTHVYGLSFAYLYKIENLRGNTNRAVEWKKKLLESTVPNKEYYLQSFN